MGSQHEDASAVSSADLCLQLRSTAADSITAAVRYLAGDRLSETAIESAAHWLGDAEFWEDAFRLLALQISAPEDIPWLSQVADGAPLDVGALVELLRSTSAAARIGADRIREARLAVLAAIDAG
jgi:hypothetical protein